MRILRQLFTFAFLALSLTTICNSVPVHAATIPSGDFSLEVSPSPLAATVSPGTPTTLELKVRNASQKTEELRIEARNFRIAYPDQNIIISNTTPPDLAEWVTFSAPVFTVTPGEWYTQKVTVSLPEAAGFSYPFTVVVSRASEPAITGSGQLLRGSVAVFTLINVDRPGSTRKLEIESLTTEQGIYEYLPATFKLKLKNTGNSIVQPYGNLYIQRSTQDSDPFSVLPVNDSRSYILPGNTKEITAEWLEGFPRYAPRDNSGERNLTWDWKDAGNFRFGRYTARVVAVYNDGTRDVPISGEVTFWVIPWRILLGLLVVLIIIGFGAWSILRRSIGHISRLAQRRPKA